MYGKIIISACNMNFMKNLRSSNYYGIGGIGLLLILSAMFYFLYVYKSQEGYLSGMDYTGTKIVSSEAESSISNAPSGVSSGSSGDAPNMSPNELLPNDDNKEWAYLHPNNNEMLNNPDYLTPGYHMGIITSGNKRNMSIDIRKEPPVPYVNTGPWNQSTLDRNRPRVGLDV